MATDVSVMNPLVRELEAAPVTLFAPDCQFAHAEVVFVTVGIEGPWRKVRMRSMASVARVGPDNPFTAKRLPMGMAKITLVCSHLSAQLANRVKEWFETAARPSEGADFPWIADPNTDPTTKKPRVAGPQKLCSHEKPSIQGALIALALHACPKHPGEICGLKPMATGGDVIIPCL